MISLLLLGKLESGGTPLSWPDFGWIAFLLLLNGFFVAAEFALVKVRTVQIDTLAQSGNLAARLTMHALDHLDAFLSAAQLGITVASLALGTMIEQKVEPALVHLLQALGIGAIPAVSAVARVALPLLALSIVTFLHMALGEQAPKSVAIRYAKPVALITAPIMVAFYYVFYPVIWLLNTASNGLVWIIGLRKIDHSELIHSEEELRHIVAESAGGGKLSRSERLMIENVLDLEDKTARRVMVPRPDIVYLSLARTPEENLHIARQSGHTRFPLCKNDLSDVLGMIHVKDILRAGDAAKLQLSDLCRPVPHFPETIHLNELLLEFQRKRVHLGLLIDEYGNVVGMVTLENVLEQLVGPIQDEFDRETPAITDLGEGRFEVEGSCPLDDLGDALHVEFPDTDASTASGLILEHLGRLAQVGDTLVVGHQRWTVVKADPKRIRKILIEPMLTSASSANLKSEPDPSDNHSTASG
jgi:CBS domain containing-hemolysin-like protein